MNIALISATEPRWNTLVERTCQRCGKTFSIRHFRLKLVPALYCSKSCASGVSYYKNCEVCGKQFKVKSADEKRYTRRFCNIECWRNGHIVWNKGKKCPELSERQMGAKNHMYGRRDEKAGHWKGGLRRLQTKIRTSPEYLAWRESVFNRDNYACRNCSKKVNGHLQAHHITPISRIITEYNIKNITDSYSVDILWDLGNGLTLCENCHALLDKHFYKFHKEEVIFN